MEEKITEEELCQYAKQLSRSGRFDHIDVVPEENIIEVYEGINSYTIFYGESWDLVLNPTISSRQICKKYKSVVIASVIISVLCFFIGMVMNYYIDLPIGSTIVVVNLCLLLILMATSKIMNKIKINK